MRFLVIAVLALISSLGGNYESAQNKPPPKQEGEAKKPVIDEMEEREIRLLQEEWKIVMESIRHFDSLLLRFRAVILSLLIAGGTIVLKF